MELPFNRRSSFSLYVLEGDFGKQVEECFPHELDLELWSRLPEDIVQKVLQHMPFSAKVRFATVCKSWYSKLLKVEALRSSAGSALPSPTPQLCCLQCWSEDARNYEISLVDYKRYGIDLSFLPFPVPHPYFFVGDGLIGYFRQQVKDTKDSTLLSLKIRLCNPMNRTWRDLPALVVSRQEVDYYGDIERCVWQHLTGYSEKWRISLRVYRDSRNEMQFELLIALPKIRYFSPSLSAICRYSSCTDLWSIANVTIADSIEDSIETAVFGDGFLYCLMYAHNFLNVYSSVDGRLCGRITMDQQFFTDTERFLRTSSYRLQPLDYHGDVLAVQDIPISLTTPAFGIWKLDVSSSKWTELTVMPQDMYDAFLSQVLTYSKLYAHRRISTVGEYIYWSFSDHHKGLMEGLEGDMDYHLVTCHIPSKTWQIRFTNLRLDFRELEDRFVGFTPRFDIVL